MYKSKKQAEKKVAATTTAHGPASSSKTDDDFLFFYMPDAEHGELCQWFPAQFTVPVSEITTVLECSAETINYDETVEGKDCLSFGCAEQFMMFCKATRFGDRQTQRAVMASDSPKEQKRLGKLVDGFEDARWDPVKSEVVILGNMCKFGQSDKLRGKLFGTGDRTLVEAASRDRIWGIGYTARHAMSHRQHWGENRLGRALMEVRSRLRAEHQKPWENY